MTAAHSGSVSGEVGNNSFNVVRQESPADTQKENREEEIEEGEIIISTAAEDSNEGTEGKWSIVTSSSGKRSNNSAISNQGLVYGHVRIASPSRYAALCDKDERGERSIESELENNIMVDDSAGWQTEIEELHKPTNGKDSAVRIPPPRSSKKTARGTNDLTSKEKDKIPSNFNKKNQIRTQ